MLRHPIPLCYRSLSRILRESGRSPQSPGGIVPRAAAPRHLRRGRSRLRGMIAGASSSRGRGGIALALLLTFCPQGIRAQQPSRWALTIRQGAADLHGELRIDSGTAGLTGRLLLENRDSSWLPLEDLSWSGDEVRFRTASLPPRRFHGTATGDQLEGEVLSGGASSRWRAFRLSPGQEYYAAPPRFLLREILIGQDDSSYHIPGAWLAAAARDGETADSLYRAYARLAGAAGLEPLPRDSLGAEVLNRAMGLYQRDRLRPRMIDALASIRAGLRGDSTRARFDYLFRPDSGWQVDLHDAALVAARVRSPGITWAAALPALQSAQLLPANAGESDVPGALYRMLARWARDSVASQEDRATLLGADSASGAAALSLLGGYVAAEGWYRRVMEFFLQDDWIPGSDGPRSVAGLMRQVQWPEPGARTPELAIRIFGYPEGSARFGLPDSSALQLVAPINAPARQWLDRHGVAALLVSVHALSSDFGEATTLDSRAGSWRVLSPGRYADEAFNGFLEPHDLILLDPSYEPVFAVGTLIHEWLHIEHERRWRAGPGRPLERSGWLLLPELDPFLAEGLAEWETERLLQPAARRLPLLLLGEAEKRASLAANNPHVLGYHLIRVLARSLGSPRAVLARLIAQGADPDALAGDAAVSRRWPRSRSADLVLPKRERHVLIPEIEFTIEDGAVRVAATRILPPIRSTTDDYIPGAGR